MTTVGASAGREVVEVDGPLFEATYALKSGQWRSGWFDVAALQPSEAGSG